MAVDPDLERCIERAAEAAVKRAVPEVLSRLGIDASEPFEMQKDLQHLRAWRKATERIYGRVGLTVITVVIAGIVAALWTGIGQVLHPPS